MSRTDLPPAWDERTLLATFLDYARATVHDKCAGLSDDDAYDRYHATETAVNGLCDYALRRDGLSFPETEPLLLRWAQEPGR